MKQHVILGAVAVAFCGAVAGYVAWPHLSANEAGAKPGGAGPKPAEKAPRPPRWAEPLQKPGLPNCHRVSKDLYRGAQPTAEGMRELKKMGVKTIVNLRSFHSDRDEIGDTGLAYEHIYMKPWHPETKEIVRFLQIVTNKARTPVFVHCQHGADRTGTMCAVYRIFVCGWPKEDAIEEMTQGGFGYHAVWGKLIEFLKELDLDDVKRRAGLGKPHEPDLSGLPNFHRVTDDLYRGAQPTAKGFRELKRMGIKTIVNLRWTVSDRWRVEDIGLNYEHVGVKSWHVAPGQFVSFLEIAADKARTPVFVYCLNGADRTGAMCAAYRVVVCGWSKEEALREMRDGRFGDDVVFKNLPRRIEEMRVEAIRKRLGLSPKPSRATQH